MSQSQTDSQSLENANQSRYPVARYPVITVDGPSGAGKGTLCLRLANELGYQLLDSGALYRIVGLQAYQAGLVFDAGQYTKSDAKLDEDSIAKLTESLDIRFKASTDSPNNSSVAIVVNGNEVGQQIRNEVVGGYASKVASLPKVREALLALQQNMAQKGGLIADGRDMGTVVFPDADAKFFLTASAKARADRRVSQLQDAGEVVDYDDILATIVARDARDENREASPSRPADDAIVIDSSAMSADAVYALVMAHCQQQGICFSK